MRQYTKSGIRLKLTRSITKKNARALVAQYLTLFEMEGWPPSGLADESQTHQIARQQLSQLRILGRSIIKLVARKQLNHRQIARLLNVMDTDQIHDALRLAVCEGHLIATVTYLATRKPAI